MSRLPEGVRRLLRLPWSRARMLRDMDDEVRAHLALRIDELRARGLSETEAETEALRRFGDAEEYRDYAARRVARHAQWRGVAEILNEWAQDVRFAMRQFRRAAGFTAVAVMTLALGVGANTAIYSVVRRLLIAPLPYEDGNRIVKLVLANGSDVRELPATLVRAARDRSRSFEMIAAVQVDALYLQDFGDTRDTIPAWVTSNYLALFGLRQVLGRGFTKADESPGSAPVAMISYGKWQRDYGGSADVLGATTRGPDVDARSYSIVGVMPPEVSIPMSPSQGVNQDLRQATPSIWLPASLDSIAGGSVFAKLRSGVTAVDASRELEAIRKSEAPPGGFQGTFRSESDMRPRAMRAQDFLAPREAQTVEVLFVAAIVLLLIACANVANLLLSRAWTRRREFAVRRALGAGRARLARLVLTESVLLALAGGLVGVGVAWLTLEVVLALRPASLDELAGLGIERAVLLWTVGTSVATGILFGSAPALFAGARSTGDVLRAETRGASAGTAARRLRATLIVLEIAMSLVLLAGAGLLARSFVALQAVPLNFRPHGLVSADIITVFARDWSAETRTAQRHELLARLSAIPGVTDASIGMMPGLGWRDFRPLETALPSGERRSVGEHLVTFVMPHYFRLARMHIVEGRAPDSLAGASPIQVVVNQTLARRLWPGGGALGASIVERAGPPGTEQTYTVVGVVQDIQMPGRRSAAGAMDVYVPMPTRMPELPVLLRTTLPDRDIVAAIRRVVAEYDPVLRGASGSPYGAVVRSVTTGDGYLSESLAPTRFAMALLLAFASVALVLSGVGLYGVIAYSVSQRTHEIGVRMALGADRRSVEGLVLRDGVRLTTVGLALGLAAAAASTRLLAGLLYGVSPVDPVTFAAIAVLVLAIALLASYVPARRAVRVDAMDALRAE